MKFIDVFKNHVPHDKEYLDKLEDIYYHEMIMLGHCVHDNSIKHYRNLPELYEFFSFIDGNGFLVEYDPSYKEDFPITISTIYTEDERTEDEQISKDST